MSADGEGLRRQAKRASDSWRQRIGGGLRRIREARGYTQAALAAAAGVDIATVTNTERGVSVPGYATLESFADILVATMDDLTGRTREFSMLAMPGESPDDADLGAQIRDLRRRVRALEALDRLDEGRN